MWNKKEKQLKKRVKQLEEQIKIAEKEYDATQRELTLYERQFNYAEKNMNRLKRLKNRIVRFIRSTAAYVVGRRNLKHLYSRSFKIKNASNRLKPYKYHLYNLGFIDKSLEDLKKLMDETTDRYLFRAIAWELVLWHANKYTPQGAEQALVYIESALQGEKDSEQLRKIAIIQAECLERLGKVEEGKQIIHHLLTKQEHPDLYLAAANLTSSITERVKWLNKALSMYNIHPIDFKASGNKVSYDDLITKEIHNKIKTGPKISVILPAFNFESGIQIAINSILKQTWENLELLIVDDCSTDNTVKVIKEFMEQDERIKLFQTPVNSGPYVARNIALKEATGEFITINDADDWSHAEKLETQALHLLENEAIVANTSEHARLTESLQLHRRGTPGHYIFSNMSSLMFRRQVVMEKLGYWDNVRFAADGEFKRRLIKTFGTNRVIDLKTGPLSLPRQSVHSLTGSSAFGYNGFFMGARKAYVESFEYYHQQADNLYYPFQQERRLYPVPEPMWPKREEKHHGRRHFDVVIAADFHEERSLQLLTKREVSIHKKLRIWTGLMQMSCYNTNRHKELSKDIRELIDGDNVQELVYGEKIDCDVLIIKDPAILQEKQLYIPNVQPKMVAVIVDQQPMTNDETGRYEFRQCSRHLMEYFNKQGIWYSYNIDVEQALKSNFKRELRFVYSSVTPWVEENVHFEEVYQSRLEDWLTTKNPYIN